MTKKYYYNSGGINKPWSPQELAIAHRMYVEEGHFVVVIANNLGRTVGAINKQLYLHNWKRRKSKVGYTPKRKITTEIVNEIRSLYAKGITQKELIFRFGISVSYISDICLGKARKNG